MGDRVDTLFQRLERLIPPPGASGWHFARLNIEAGAMGADVFAASTQDEQAQAAEDQLRLGATLQRVDENPEDWNVENAVSWRLKPVLDPGATSYFLDLWGRTLSVPRMDGELDQAYAKRIVADISRSTTTNVGLAEAIDVALGTSGTRVIDASAVLQFLQFNNGHRMNSGLRFNNAGSAKSLECCFVVQMTIQPQDADLPKFTSLVNSRKAAGTRLVGIMTGAILTPLISSPSSVPQNALFNASAIVDPTGVTAYHWSVEGGTVQSGAGTPTLSILSGSGGFVTITLSVTKDGSESPIATRDVIVVDSDIEIPSALAYAGDGPFMATAPLGYGYSWTITNGYLIGTASNRTVQFAVGEKEQVATLTCQMANGITVSTQITIIPFTSSISATTASLEPDAAVDLEMDLGWEYELATVESSRPAWVRIYNTAAARASDASRPSNQEPPSALVDLVWEGFFSAGALVIHDNPDVVGVNGNTPRTKAAYLRVVNLDTVAGPVAITVTRTETRTSGVF